MQIPQKRHMFSPHRLKFNFGFFAAGLTDLRRLNAASAAYVLSALRSCYGKNLPSSFPHCHSSVKYMWVLKSKTGMDLKMPWTPAHDFFRKIFFINFRNGLNLMFLFTKLFLYVNLLMKIIGNNIFFEVKSYWKWESMLDIFEKLMQRYSKLDADSESYLYLGLIRSISNRYHCNIFLFFGNIFL